MRANLILCVVALVVGFTLLRILLSRGRSQKAPWVVPLAALIAGPSVAFIFWAIDVYVIFAGDYISSFERLELLPDILAIGILVGFASAIAICRLG